MNCKESVRRLRQSTSLRGSVATVYSLECWNVGMIDELQGICKEAEAEYFTAQFSSNSIQFGMLE
jgi:hypothetical protein